MTDTETGDQIEWVDTPPVRQEVSPYDKFASQLRERPGHWAILSRNRKSSHTLASNIRQGKYKAFRPSGAYDALSREGIVYAIFLGITEEEKAQAQAALEGAALVAKVEANPAIQEAIADAKAHPEKAVDE
jgi:hypothetical protein